METCFTPAAPSPSPGRPVAKDEYAPVLCFFHLLIQHLRACRASHILVLFTMAVGAMGMSATFFIGDGALTRLWEDMDRLIGSQISILPDPGPNGALLKKRSVAAFTPGDLEALRDTATAARHIAPYQVHRAMVSVSDIESAMMVEGLTAILTLEPAFRPVKGRGLSTAAETGQTFECLITESVETRLHATLDSRIIVDGRYFTVVGIVPDPPTADSRFQTRVIVPYPTAQKMYGRPGFYDGFVAIWNRPEDMDLLLDQIKETLDRRVGPDCYYLSSSRIIAQKRKTVVANIMAFGAAQAFFCVLVASIGVANVMLANVVRRRREYAIRITMGARQSEIFWLVLCESMVIGIAGGFLGIALGAGVAQPLCRALAAHIQEVSHLTPVFGWRGVLIPLAACGISGLLAGLFPALQIRRLDVLPILHTE